MPPHNPQIVYAGSQVLFRSLNRGDAWEAISGDLTTNDTDEVRPRIRQRPLLRDHDDLGVTGPGGCHLDRHRRRQGAREENHGAAWIDVTALIAATGGPADRYVSRVSRPRTMRPRRSS